MLKKVLISFFVTSMIMVPTSYAAEPYPEKPVRVVIGFGPGGLNDIVARIICKELTERLGKAFIVENKAGSSGSIGADFVAKATSDGYTILLGSVSNVVIAPAVYSHIPYDPVKSFVPIAMVGGTPNILVVNPISKITSLKDLISMAKAKPGSLAYASAGNGASNHLAGELFKTIVGIDAIHVPYKGDSPALIGLMGGETQYMFATIPAAISFINGGKLNALGVTSPQRSALTPDVPTFTEFGIKNFYVNVWAGFLAPIGTPQHIVNKLSNEIIEITKLDSVQKQLLAQGVEPNPLGSAAFGMVIKSDLERWREVAKSASIASK